MANKVLPKARERMLAGGLNLLAGTVKAQLIDTAAYTYSDAHQFLSDIPSAARIGAPVTLANKSITNGVFDADDLAFSGLTSAPTIEALAYYVDTGAEATSPFFLFTDTATGLPIPAGATGGTVTHDNGANKIFAV